MNTMENVHLNEQEIIIAVVDTADLSRPQREHLADCSRCRSQIEALEGDLDKMAQIAEASSPAVAGPFRAPAAEKAPAGWRPFGRKFAAGIAATAACVVIGALIWHNQLSDRHRQLAREMAEAEQLMRQVNVLVENPLPDTIMTIAAEGILEHDEDFFRFLIPDDSGGATLSRSGKKGLMT